MEAKTQTKIRNAVKKIRADMENDPDIRKQVAQNHIRVLAERGGLSLPEIILPMTCGARAPPAHARRRSACRTSADAAILWAAPTISASVTIGRFSKLAII